MDEPKQLKKLSIHGYSLNYDYADYDGVRYLYDQLSADESKVFFKQAYEHGEAQFEDRYKKNFSITYKGGEYTLHRRTS